MSREKSNITDKRHAPAVLGREGNQLPFEPFDLRRNRPRRRASCHGAKATICLGLGIVVKRPGATCSEAVEADSR